MYEGVDTVVLHDELAYEDVLPVSWRPLAEPLDSIGLASLTDRNVKLLQVCAAIEEHGSIEKQDKESPHSADLLRIEVKMNLLLELVGQILVASQPRPKPVSVRFNALGVVWKSTGSAPEMGRQGILEIYLRDCLASPLSLIARVSSVTPDGQVKARLVPPGEQIADLIEKLAFRRHRRQVAGVRQPRRA
ncbi:MAG: PilZ domain-containing protein [Steroidobacteraceae bacterium]